MRNSLGYRSTIVAMRRLIAVLALAIMGFPNGSIAEQRRLTQQEEQQLYAHRIWDFSTEESTLSSILWLADVGGQGGWSGPVDLDAHRRIASQCRTEILTRLRTAPAGSLEGYAKGVANLMAHTDRVRMYPERLDMDNANADPLWPCFALAAGVSAGDYAGAQKRLADQTALRSYIEQSCSGEINAYISQSIGLVNDGGAGMRRSTADTIRQFSENSLLGLQGYQHNISAGVPGYYSQIPGRAQSYGAQLNMWACFFRAKAQFEGGQQPSTAPPPQQASAQLAAPPSQAQATRTPGPDSGHSALADQWMNDAYAKAPHGWQIPANLMPRNQGKWWEDERYAGTAERAAAGAWIEKALAPGCANEFAAISRASASSGELIADDLFNLQSQIGYSLSFGIGGLKTYRSAIAAATPKARTSSSYRAATGPYLLCIVDQRIRQTDPALVAPAYQPLNDQMQEAFQRQQEGRTERLHNHANDATACLSVVATGTKVEWGASGKFKLVNTCGYPVAASWCANTRDCEHGVGNLWTIPAGRDYPVFFADAAHPDIRVGACRVGSQATTKVDVVANSTGVSMVDTAHDPPQAAPGVSIMPGHRCD